MDRPVNPSRHDTFYFEVEACIFQVEDKLFKTDRHLIARHSPVFSAMFSLPSGDAEKTSGGCDGEGLSDDLPLFLPGVSVLEFESLLTVLYQGMFSGFAMKGDKWIAALSISHRFDFSAVYARAITALYTAPLKKDTAVDLIGVAERYDVPLKDIAPALKYVIAREEYLSADDISRLSYKTAASLAQARERMDRYKRSGASSFPERLTLVVEELWGKI